MTALAGQVAVVTGASRGIGAATASALDQAGATVVGLARTVPAGDHGRQHNVPCDLTDPAQLQEAAEAVLSRFGPPRIVVNNAGGFVLAPFEATDAAAFAGQLAINLQAPFAVARAFLPAMRRAGQGLFISVGSVADHTALPENSAYAASKFGLRGLHQSLAAEYRGTGVRFTLISPGPTDTDLWNPVDPDHRDGFLPRSRMLRPEDVAAAIMFAATQPTHVQLEWLRLGPV